MDRAHPGQHCHTPVLGGTGRGFEHHRVRHNGRCHKPRHLLRGHEASLLEHAGHNGSGGAHRLVPDIDGVGGLDVRQPVMVNDLQDLGLLQARDRLGPLVVVHQHHPFCAVAGVDGSGTTIPQSSPLVQNR